MVITEEETYKDLVEFLWTEWLSLLHCVASGVSPELTFGKMSMSGWIYSRRIRLLRGYGFNSAEEVCIYGALLWEAC